MTGLRRRSTSLTRRELAHALDVSSRAVDRLIRRGLRPSGRRGRSALYSVHDARQAQRAHADATTTSYGTALIDLLGAQAAEAKMRAHELAETFIADAAWRPAWRAEVRAVTAVMRRWPAILAHTLTTRAATPPAPVRLRPRPLDALTFWRALAAEPGLWPIAETDLLERAERMQVLSTRALPGAAGALGIVLRAGCWHLPAPGLPPETRDLRSPEYSYVTSGDPIQADDPPRAAVRPLLDALARSPAVTELGVLAPPAAPAPLERPASIGDAKGTLIRERAQLVQLRLVIRREHWPRRADVRFKIDDAITRVRTAWWSAWPGRISSVDQPAAADWRRAATETLRDAIAALEAPLDGRRAAHRAAAVPRRKRKTTLRPARARRAARRPASNHDRVRRAGAGKRER